MSDLEDFLALMLERDPERVIEVECCADGIVIRSDGRAPLHFDDEGKLLAAN